MVGRRGTDRPAVMFLDIDRFKLVNDTYGHQTGDELLIQITSRLCAVLRTTRHAGALRWRRVRHPVRRRRRLRSARPDHRANPGGVRQAVPTRRGRDRRVGEHRRRSRRPTPAPAPRLSSARPTRRCTSPRPTALRARCRSSTTTCAAPARDRVRIEHDLAHALARDELVLHYQPIIDVATRRIDRRRGPLAVEPSASGGCCSPGEFLEPAERTGLIVPIGEWVLANACATVTGWNRQRPAGRPPPPRGEPLPPPARRVRHRRGRAVGHRGRRHRSGRAAAVVRAHRELGRGGRRASSVQRSASSHGLGITLAIDDFGSGYSSLAYVRDFPVRGREDRPHLHRRARDAGP